MSDRALYDALPHDLPRSIRSKLLLFATFETSEFIPEFQYDKLPADRKRIRLLRLLPGVLQNPQIDCEMFEAEFDKDHNLVHVKDLLTIKPQHRKQKAKNKLLKPAWNGTQESNKSQAESSKQANSKEEEVNGRDQVTQDGKTEYNSKPEGAKSDDKKPEDTKADGNKPEDTKPNGNKLDGARKKKKRNKKVPKTDINDIIQYEALSWRWGDEAKGPHIIMVKKMACFTRKGYQKPWAWR